MSAPDTAHWPREITYDSPSKRLQIDFDNGAKFSLPAEYLRVYSPSAEVQGHGPGQEVLQIGKHNVNIDKIEQVGHYAIQLFFDDNHDTGIYSWETLYKLGKDYENNWQRYVERLKEAGHEHPKTKHLQ